MSYETFVKMYNDYSISTRKIKELLGNGNYERYRRRAVRENTIKLRPSSLRYDDSFYRFSDYKFYYYDKQRKKYRVKKVLNGEFISFGFFDTEEEAKKVVMICKECNWDKEEVLKRLKGELDYGD